MRVVLQLGCVLFIVYVWIRMKSQHPHLTFPSFFFFLFFDARKLYCAYCLCSIHGIHSHFIKKYILKIGLIILFIYLKIILLQYF